jgi:hypothetical protein
MSTMTLTRDQVRAIEWDCQMALARFLQALDGRDGPTAAAQFAENGKWERSMGGAFEGRAQIAENIANRTANVASRHCMSNFVLDLKDADHAESRCYLTVFRNEATTANVASRHCMSNFVLDLKDADHAESRCYLTVFRNEATGPEPVKLPIKMELPSGVLLYCDKWVRTPEGWRIAEQWSERIFTR